MMLHNHQVKRVPLLLVVALTLFIISTSIASCDGGGGEHDAETTSQKLPRYWPGTYFMALIGVLMKPLEDGGGGGGLRPRTSSDARPELPLPLPKAQEYSCTGTLIHRNVLLTSRPCVPEHRGHFNHPDAVIVQHLVRLVDRDDGWNYRATLRRVTRIARMPSPFTAELVGLMLTPLEDLSERRISSENGTLSVTRLEVATVSVEYLSPDLDVLEENNQNQNNQNLTEASQISGRLLHFADFRSNLPYRYVPREVALDPDDFEGGPELLPREVVVLDRGVRLRDYLGRNAAPYHPPVQALPHLGNSSMLYFGDPIVKVNQNPKTEKSKKDKDKLVGVMTCAQQTGFATHCQPGVELILEQLKPVIDQWIAEGERIEQEYRASLKAKEEEELKQKHQSITDVISHSPVVSLSSETTNTTKPKRLRYQCRCDYFPEENYRY